MKMTTWNTLFNNSKKSVSPQDSASLTIKAKRPWRVTMLVLLAGAFASLSALAQEHPTAGSSDAAVTAEDSAAVLAYWTPERLSNAKPMPLVEADMSVGTGVASAPTSQEPQVFVEGQRPEINTPPSFNGPYIGAAQAENPGSIASQPLAFSYVYPFSTYYNNSYAGYPSKTIGRLFFTLEGSDYSCSASVIRAHTLVTARHCVFDYSTGKFGSNWVFYPDYNNGKADTSIGTGTWTAEFAFTWTTGAAGMNYDIGLLALHDENGKGCHGDTGTNPIEHYTGYLGYTTGGDFSQRQWAVFGYPGETNTTDGNPFNGNWEIRTDAATGNVNDSIGGIYTNTIEIGSDMTGGASGGPWIIGYNPGGSSTFTYGSNNTYKANTHNDGNFANSVNSFKFTSPSHPLAINGPEFDGYNFSNLLTAYNKHSCS
jgi:V8-like Glu-specific endopeptidase